MTINWETIERICISIAVIGAAITYAYKAYKFTRKPSEDINEKLDRDFKKIRAMEDEQLWMKDAIKILIRSNLAILGHMGDGNHTGEMSKMEKEIQDFLIHN